ncbi:MAG: uracil-DNA glycosylase [Methanomassiliicoccales archaeon]|nr:uracil-DNA glycosylase [Methanomassiliicoccales archaeon]
MFLDLNCDLCPLCRGRTRVVAPSGDYSSPVVLVGEAPGEREDLSGAPFVGRAGKMLDRLLEEEGLPRGSVMITNVVKCRPPRNRRPKEDEVQACRPYLEDDLKGKMIIVCLGKTACEALLGYKVTLKEVANQTFTIALGRERIDLVPTYHPSAALRNLEAREGLRATIRLILERFPDLQG